VKGGFFDTGELAEKFEEEKKRFDRAGSFLDSVLD
jgi:hypothetical protein